MTKPVLHDETPSGITDHAFIPKRGNEWWSLCKHCNFAESAHAETEIKPIARQDGSS